MKKRRIIPVILLRNGHIVQSRFFQRYQKLGSPNTSIKRFSEWCSDELIFLDISKNEIYDIDREDVNFKNETKLINIIKQMSKVATMPVTVGGKIKSLKNAEDYLINGADKISINSQAQLNPNFLKNCAKEFGSQCVVNSVDILKEDGNYNLFYNGKLQRSKYSLIEWIKISQDMGVGEFFFNSIDRDGSAKGYDYELCDILENNVKTPFIFCGGAGSLDDFYNIASKSKVDGIAAANFFQYTEHSVYKVKDYLYKKNLNFRKPEFIRHDLL